MKKANYKDGEASLAAQMVKCVQCRKPMFHPWVGERYPEEGRAIHSSILARRTPWTEVPGELVHGVAKRVRHD